MMKKLYVLSLAACFMMASFGFVGAAAAEIETLSVVGDSNTTVWGPIYSPYSGSWTSYVQANPYFAPDSPAWTNPHPAAYTATHPWEGYTTFSAPWIFFSPSYNSVGPGGQNWSKYETTFEIPGDIVSAKISWAGDNYSWVYVNGELVNDDLGIVPNVSVLSNFITSDLEIAPFLNGGEENTIVIVLYDGGGLGGLKFRVDVEYDVNVQVEVGLDIDPNTINLASKGNDITCYIGLPEGTTGDSIDLLLEGSVAGVSKGVNDDGLLVVKFDRNDVHALLSPGIITLTVEGTIDGQSVIGSDMVRVIDKGKK